MLETEAELQSLQRLLDASHGGAATLAYLDSFYGSSPLSWGDTRLFRLKPSWIVGFAADRERLLINRGLLPPVAGAPAQTT